MISAKRVRTLFALSLFGLLVMSFASAGMKASEIYSLPTIYLDIPTTASVGENFIVSLKVADVVTLWGWQVKLEWDSALMELVSVVEGDFLKTGGATSLQASTNQILGRSWIVGYLQYPPLPGGVSGSGTLMNATFRCTSPGESAFNLSFTRLFTGIQNVPWNGYGDADGNGIINIYDAAIVSGAAFAVTGDPNYYPQADFNMDGIVDYFDVFCVTFNFMRASPNPVDIPVESVHTATGGSISQRALSAWTFITPAINGRISPRRTFYDPFTRRLLTEPGEWDDAAKIDFTLTYGTESHLATLYVKNDYLNLYLALKVKDEDYDFSDDIFFNFDNNHNGIKEVGDDQLCVVGGSKWFKDSFFIADGSSVEDQLYEGSRDGAGAARFDTSTSTWDFEVVHPLNTKDNAHDFSLSPENTVGFNLVYRDAGGSEGTAGWPTFTFNDWTQMTDIKIAKPRRAPPSSDVDLTITGIEVTQAVQFLNNSLPLVRDKTTAVRVYIDIGPLAKGPIDATVFLYGVDGGGESLGVLSRSFSAPDDPDRGIIADTANFILPSTWVNRGSLVLKAFVKASSAFQSEQSYSNNWIAEQSFSLFRTNVPTIYIVPINTGTDTSPTLVADAVIAEAENYFRTIYPVASVNFVRLGWERIGANQPGPGNTLLTRLTQLGLELGLTSGGIDQIFGFTPTGGGISDPLWWNNGQGIAACGFWGTSQELTMAHEIDHNWGPGGGWGQHIGGTSPWGATADESDLNWPYRNEPATTRFQIHEYGYDTLQDWVIPDFTSDLMSYNMTPGSIRDSTDPLTMHSKWISPYRWRNVFNLLEIEFPTLKVGRSLMISGRMWRNGAASLDPVLPIPWEQESPSIPGNYSLVLQDNFGADLLTRWFNPQFVNAENQTQDPAYFTMLLPDNTNATRILLKFGSTVLDEMEKSPNLPQVTVLAPNGGEVWSPGLHNISWTANDLDNDTLTYIVYYSSDNGVSWTPLSPSLAQKSYQIDASFIQASNQGLIRVVASDGFNFGEDTSNAVFTVANKPPTAKIIRPINGSQFYMDDVILLRGNGNDADDIMLPETAYNWASDIDGYLGNGETLTTLLTIGTHKITLTVTDSQNSSATDTIFIAVAPYLEITAVQSSKTVLGQGYLMPISVTVANVGPTVQTFNVTTYYNQTPIETKTISNLTSGSAATLQFMWNTTGVPKGVHLISAAATLDQYEVAEFGDAVQVVMKGDVIVDGTVDIYDIIAVASWFGSDVPPAPPNYDIIEDKTIDIYDILVVATHFGETDP